jgi:hypothetical protein
LRRGSTAEDAQVAALSPHADDLADAPLPSKPKPRFSLFAAPRSANNSQSARAAGAVRQEQNEDADLDADADADVGDETMHADDRARGDDEDQTIHANANIGIGSSRTGQSSADRDERLRESLYELRSMNEVFDGFLNALEAAKGHNEVSFVLFVAAVEKLS